MIANAEDWANADFACYMSQFQNEGIQQLDAPVYDADKKTLTLKAKADDNLLLYYIPWFNFGDSSKDLNLCSDNSASYYW